METLKSTIFWLNPDSTFVSFLKIMADVKESGSSEGITEVANLSVSCYHTGEPIIRNANRRNDRVLAAILEASFREHSDLLNDVIWLSIGVRAREDVSVVQENNSDTFDHTLMDSEGTTTGDIDVDIVFVMDSGWVL